MHLWANITRQFLYISDLKPASKELVFNLEEVPSAHFSLKWLIEDGKPRVILHILPTGITVANGIKVKDKSFEYNTV